VFEGIKSLVVVVTVVIIRIGHSGGHLVCMYFLSYPFVIRHVFHIGLFCRGRVLDRLVLMSG
jgi:hypothetical protein